MVVLRDIREVVDFLEVVGHQAVVGSQAVAILLEVVVSLLGELLRENRVKGFATLLGYQNEVEVEV